MKLFRKNNETPTREITHAGHSDKYIQDLAKKGDKIQKIEILPPEQRIMAETNRYLKWKIFMKRKRKEEISKAVLVDKDYGRAPSKLLKRIREYVERGQQEKIIEIINKRKFGRRMATVGVREIGAGTGIVGGLVFGGLIGGVVDAAICGLIGGFLGLAIGTIIDVIKEM